MLACPNCGKRLVRQNIPAGISFDCEKCGGRIVGISVLRRSFLSEDFLNRLWLYAKSGMAPEGRKCPHCRKSMSTITMDANGTALELDVCGICQQVWFDPEEFSEVPRQAVTFHKKEEMPIEAREKLAIAMMNYEESKIRDRFDDMESDNQGPPSLLGTIPAVFGIPVEMNSSELSRKPWVTWGLAAVLIAIFALSLTAGLNSVVKQWGFVPALWQREYGLTLITSFFLHAGILHLIFNLYFLVIFGDNVEDHLGKVKYILLIVLSTLCGVAVHWISDRTSTIPCIGASGGICGIIAYYAVLYPHSKLGFFLRFNWHMQWINIPVWCFLGIYIALQIAGGIMDLKMGGTSGTAWFAHLGGLGAGLISAFAEKISASGKLRHDPIQTAVYDNKSASDGDYYRM